MASSGKFDLSSSSPGRSLHTKRGSYTGATMDNRSISFRDNMENPILSSLPSMSRTTTNVSQVDVTNFFQCLRFDLKSMATEYKCNRYGDYKRLASAALCAPDDSPSPSGLLKGKLSSSSSPEDVKRLRVGLRESTIKARERVKIFSDVLSVMNKCFPSIPSRKRSRPDDRSSVGKMGSTQSYAFDYEQPKVEDRGKNVLPNKRTRTSMADARPNTPARSSGSVDNREVSRLPNSNTLEDRALPIVGDGWEKTKMKKKRTGIKADSALGLGTSSIPVKPINGIRDSRQGVHPRSVLDARSRLNSHGFRSGVDAVPTTMNTSLLHERRDQVQPTNFISGTPSSTPKPHGTTRGPRSGTGGIPKLPHGCTNKNPGVVGPTNRKRTSPPVTQWADRRPQKISRTARRTNLVPVVSTSDEMPTLGNNDVEKKRGFAKRFPVNSPKQFKSKVDHLQSESEESGGGGSGIRSDEVQKMSTLVLPTRKNKFLSEDGVCKQGRTGRGFASARSAKQLKTGRVGVDKPESKAGRPPTRKLSGRKAYMRQKHSTITTPTDFLVASDDGHEELLAAANSVINPGCASSGSFWRQMDRLFGFISDADVAYIKQEGSIQSTDKFDTYPSQKTETECSSEYPEGISGTSLCQRLLAALISEEDNSDYTYDVYESETNGSFLNGYRIDSPLRSCNEVADSGNVLGFDHCYKGILSETNTSIDERLLIEIHSLGLYPDLVQTGDEDVNSDIRRLEEKHHQHVSRKKTLLNKLLKSTEEARKLHEKEFEELSLEKLTRLAYHKYMNCWGPNAPGGKGTSGKIAKQAALACVKRTLDQCHEYETTGKSCFSKPLFREIFTSGLSQLDCESTKPNETFSGTQESPSSNNFDMYKFDIGKDDSSSRGKKREVWVDDVAGSSPGSVGRAIMNSVKGKRSERESSKVERKTKTKLKQKTSEILDEERSFSSVIPDSIDDMALENFEEPPLDLSHLQLPDMEEFMGGGGGGGGGQGGEDIGSWLNIEEDVLQDDDFMGLEIPMDDLNHLDMMV